jgi:hypothetical protein
MRVQKIERRMGGRQMGRDWRVEGGDDETSGVSWRAVQPSVRFRQERRRGIAGRWEEK